MWHTMKLVNFESDGAVFDGRIEGDMVLSGKDRYRLDEVRLLPPCLPSKIVCVGLNYRDHARELGMKTPEEPVIFLKPPSAVIGPGDDIVYPAASGRVDYEAELAVVIGREAGDISPDEAHEYILGYSCFNDVTARDLQERDGQWTRAKSFDTFAPIGPWIETELDTSDIFVRSFLNGMPRQESRTSQFLFDVPRLVSFISGIMTLFPGDVIATGTPAGIGPMSPGDEVSVEIEGIGVLRNKVVNRGT